MLKKIIWRLRVEVARMRVRIGSRNWNLRNRNRPRVYVFTDSRGVDVQRPMKRNNPYGGYVAALMRRYSVSFEIVPKKHTTIADFFEAYEKTDRDFDAVVLHAFAVDVAPRPKSSVIRDFYELKKESYDALFGEEAMRVHLEGDLGVAYEGEVTHCAFSQKMAVEKLVPRLRDIPNLVFIGSNPVLSNWGGSYWKERPANLTLIADMSHAVCELLPNSIDLSGWGEDEIKRYTSDNIHFNASGHEWLADRILTCLDPLVGSPEGL